LEQLLCHWRQSDSELNDLFPATPPDHIRRSALMILVLWLHFSRSSHKESFLEEGVVDNIFKLVATCGVRSEVASTNRSHPTLSPEEGQSCDCESSPFVSSEFDLQLATTALILLCDEPSSAPDSQLSVSHFHLSIIRTIPPLVANYLHTKTHPSDDPKPLIAIAMLFYQLAHHLREKILPDYEHWVEVAIEGTGHWSHKAVRKYFALALRTLVPLAPLLLRSLQWKDSLLARPSLPNTSNLVGGVFLSQYPLLSERYLGLSTSLPCQSMVDRSEEMRERISQLGQTAEEKVSQSIDLSRLLRPYQLKGPSFLTALSLYYLPLSGIEWILQLWRSGLGGVLADEMGLGKVRLCATHSL
jgi:hypothetical protein